MTTQPTTPREVEQTAQLAREYRDGLVEVGMPREDAINLAVLMALFLRKNAAVLDQLFLEGHSPETIGAAALASFKTYCNNAYDARR